MKKILIMILALFTLCACGVEKVKNEKDINNRLADEGFVVTDVTVQMNDKRISYVAAANNNKYQVEYYVFREATDAKEAYKGNVDSFNASGKKGKEKTKNGYTIYTQKLSDKYSIVIRDNKILIYSSVNIEYKRDLNKVLNKLGY